MLHVLDLSFSGYDQAIAAFLLESEEGPILLETGPYSTYDNLRSEVRKLEYEVEEIRHVFITHIHLDHAGAAWALARNGSNLYVHPKGIPHLVDPSKLYNSAKRIYGDEMDTLWGRLEPIDAERLLAAEDEHPIEIGGRKIIPWHTPGHAVHHVAWQLDDIMVTGDLAGVKIGEGPIMPPCPPPDIDIEVWMDSINKARRLNCNELYLTHFGIIEDPTTHFDNFQNILLDWSSWIKVRMEQEGSIDSMTPVFQSYVAEQLRSHGCNQEEIDRYEAANPSWMSVAGLARYWSKKMAK